MKFLITHLRVALARRPVMTLAPPSVSRLTVARARSARLTAAAERGGFIRPAKPATACALMALALSAALASASNAAASGTGAAGPPLAHALASAASQNTGDPSLATQRAVLTDQGISAARADEALAVQAEVAQADLSSKLQAAMGSAFAGTWFENAAALLHVGVTSAASRQAAGRAVAQAGLTAHVVETPVRSTWAALIAAQNDWNKRLAQLLSRAEAATGIDPPNNAVSVMLSSSVPASERIALEDEAATASVNVSVSVEAPSQLQIEPRAVPTCKEKFVTFEAYCEKTLTSGVDVEFAEPLCTAGPMLIEGNETYVLTSGHCFKKETPEAGEAIKSAISSKYPSALAEKRKIGEEGTSFYNKERDFAEIKIEPGSAFTQALPTPVPAFVTEWKENPKTPHAVAGSMAVEAGQTACHEGMTSGENCGEVKKLNVSFDGKAHLVEVTACGSGGDSGGPYFVRGKGGEIFMIGMETAGLLPECGEPGILKSYFEPLRGVAGAEAFGILQSFNGQALLTTANETRPTGAGPLFKVNGKALGTGETRLLLESAKETVKVESKALGVTVECTGLTLPEAARMQVQGLVAGSGSTSKEAIEFKGCTQKGNGESCSVEGSAVKTVSLLNLLGFQAKEKSGFVYVLFEPESGKAFATVKFTGAGCTLASAGVTGNVIGQARVAGVPVVAGSGTETLQGEVKFPGATAIWIERGKAVSEVKAKLELAGTAATLSGLALLSVDEGGVPVKWGVFS
jgi:hypothetical protein